MDKPKDVDEFIFRQRAAIAANPECGTSHYNLGIGLLGKKRYAEAEEEFHLAIDCSPSLAEAYAQLGGLCLMRGDLEGCLDYNKRAIHSRAGFSEGYGNIGFVELQRGNAEAAVYNLKKAIRYNARFVQAYTTLANAYLMLGRVDESIEANLRALEVQPDFAVAHNNLAIAYLEKGLYEEAAAHCEKARALGYEVPDEIEAQITSGLEN